MFSFIHKLEPFLLLGPILNITQVKFLIFSPYKIFNFLVKNELSIHILRYSKYTRLFKYSMMLLIKATCIYKGNPGKVGLKDMSTGKIMLD